MNSNYDKLKKLLAELFQYDRADLDFGIYRIMNQKREEISSFLNADLLPQVRSAFAGYQSADRAELKMELEKATEAARSLGVDPDATAKVQELRARYGAAPDQTALENDVFGDLYNFFRRYYSDGDFISLRRYRPGVYAIPYEGEEVKLHWANADQYYIKSSENFRDYAFRLPDGRLVHFRLVEADTERDDVKAASGKERRFVLAGDPVVEEHGELVIRFEYRPHPAKQTTLVEEAVAAITADDRVADWRDALETLAPTETNPTRILLAKHLADYTARNTFDYFIHKDLGGFLRRELDFFIKNEVMYLDDIELETVPRVEQYLSRIKVLRSIAHKIIDFLAQLENFQKRLWLKKKFVTECGWCVTLDRVPRELYPEIAANEEQRGEWVRLFAIDAIGGDLVTAAYSEPLTVPFLESSPHLPIDTKFFPPEFTTRLLASFDDLDEACDGLLVHGENFQALNLLLERYRGEVKCIYIDPPYNTHKDVFPYKDGYKHSSWLSMVNDRLIIAKEILSSNGVLLSSIDINERAQLELCMDEVFGQANGVGELVWRNARDNNPTRIAMEHESILCYARDLASADSTWKNDFSDAKELMLQEYARLQSLKVPLSEMQSHFRRFIKDNEAIIGELDRYKFIDQDGVYTGSQSVHNPHPGGYEYEILHPVTGKPMRLPANGYRFPEGTMQREFIDKGRLIFGPDEERIVQIKLYLRDYKDSLRSVIDLDGRLGAYALGALFGKGANVFDNPKPPQLIKRLISFGGTSNAVVLDFFAGSGSTAVAAIEIHRQTHTRLKYILVEMGEYFDTVLKPRVQKVIYSADWKDGRPVSRVGSSHMFKYIRLESYEDTLNNLELRRTSAQTELLEAHASLREDYTLRYMLDVESRGSASLLNVDALSAPDRYTLCVGAGSVGETRPVTVDLVETLNYLLGLRVRRRRKLEDILIVSGETPDGEEAVILWRDTEITDNDALERFFREQGWAVANPTFAVVYVNGDNTLANLRPEGGRWRVRLIEEELLERMFTID